MWATCAGTASIFDFVSTVAMGTIIGSTIISSSIALTTGLIGLTALVALQWSMAYAPSRSGRFYQTTTNTPRDRVEATLPLDRELKVPDVVSDLSPVVR